MRKEAKYSSTRNAKGLLTNSIKKNSNLSFLLCASAAFVLLQASDASANPTGATVVSGGINISTPSAGNLVINQSTNQAIINWDNFDIAAGESTQFIQPSSNSVALNRITDGNPTQILGRLSANGKLMVVNPNGVFFGENSRVDVAGLIASTANITDNDFLAGKTNLSIAGRNNAQIVNRGHITAAEGGLVALIAPSVRNDGIIQANLGTVALASAQTASIDFYGDNLYSFALDKETTASAQNEQSAVTNSGIISVGGGKVLLTAKVAKGVVDNVINNTGIIEAVSSHMEGGVVVLSGGDGNVNISGEINVAGETGGKVTVTGENITLAAANINASGKNGGGTVKIGGDYQGKGETPRAKTVKVDAASKINVSATDSGNGGTSIVWSDEATSFSGSILGTGGKNGGDGGLAEVSSKGKLGYNGSADLHATDGEAGTLLLDPGNLTLASAGFIPLAGDFFVDVASIAATLDGGTNSIQTATNDLNVINDIVWNGSGSLTLNAGNNISLVDSAISTINGSITTNSIGIDLDNSSIKTVAGNVDINNTGKFYSNLANVLEGQSVSLNQSTAGVIQNAIDAVGTTGAGGALLQLGSGTWTETASINQGNFTLKGNGVFSTTINAPSALSTIISVGAGNDDVTISDLAVSGGRNGVSVTNNSNFVLNNVMASGAGHNGLLLNNTNNALVVDSKFNNNNVGVNLQQASNTKVDENHFYNNTFGINSIDSTSSEITGNILDSDLVGMSFNGDSDLTINNQNIFYGSNAGIILVAVNNADISDNEFNYVNLGVSASGGSAITIDSNFMESVNFGVIAGDNTKNIKVINNTILGGDPSMGSMKDEQYEQGGEPGSYAIRIKTGKETVLVDNNIVDNFVMGIGVENSENVDVSHNAITDTVEDAIFLNSNSNVVANENDIDVSTRGIYSLSNTGNVSFSDNDIRNSLYGIVVEGTHDVGLSLNTLTNNGTGMSFYDSNNATLAGDVFNGNVLGIDLDNSQNAFIGEASITSPINGAGVLIQNGSSGTLARGLNINNGGVGVILDGSGSSMQFTGNTSAFSGQERYFVLQNNAMFAGASLAQADSLDASQQTFDGVRASDFTIAQRDAAEAITTDIEDGFPTIGNVFYKIFTTTPVAFGTDGLIPTQEFVFNAARFSYAGRTVNNDPSVTSPTYYVPGLNLSLLSQTAGGSAGVNVAGLTPSQLGGLEPAAGGNTLASLAPAAGGANANCVNSFLQSGFNNNFNSASCFINQ